MARWLLVLVLTVAVGLGVVDACPDGGCADEQGAALDDGDGDCAQDDRREPGDESDRESCPPLCGGCPRVTAEPPRHVALKTVALAAADAPIDAPRAPITAPPLHGLFRPPRA